MSQHRPDGSGAALRVFLLSLAVGSFALNGVALTSPAHAGSADPVGASTQGAATSAKDSAKHAKRPQKKPSRPGPLGIPARPNGDRDEPAKSRPAPSAPPTPARSTPPPARPDNTGENHQRPDHAEEGQPRPTAPGPRPSGGSRPYEGGSTHTPPARGDDHRYARPEAHHVRPAHEANHPPPGWYYYRPYYTRWYVHPYYRSYYSTTVVVLFPFPVYPWVVTWAPAPRADWIWVPGATDTFGLWIPGHWEPVGPPPTPYPGAHYVYVPGWWQDGLYIDGYWRISDRSGWVWVEGTYGVDQSYVPGYWHPSSAAPEGYVWEPGWFDGETWVEGFWRPRYRAGYAWVSAYLDEDSIYHGGYWRPVADQAGYTWVPGWFDGTEWVDGSWVPDSDYQAADPQAWTPPEGWDDGRSETSTPTEAEELPLALPVNP